MADTDFVPAAAGDAPAAPSPFPQEAQAQQQPETTWNPWTGPAKPHWYSGMGVSEDTAYLGPFYRALESVGKGAAMGEETLAGIWHTQGELGAKYLGNVPLVGAYYRALEKSSAAQLQDARERVKTMTPDPTTTGAAAQLVNGLGSTLYRYTAGSLFGGPLAGALTVGTTETTSRYHELLGEGVTPGAAGASAGVSGVFSAAGALMPAGFGTSLVGKILTGAGSNVGFGLLSRYADHKVLEAAGYPEMAAQQDVWDKTAMATDLILGGGFGVIAHAHAKLSASKQEADAKFGRDVPGVEDAALTANLAMRDRASAPGVPVDPQAAQAHQTALETALQDVLQGKPVDVAGTGVENSTFAARPQEDRSNVQALFVNALKDGGFLEHEQNLRALEETLGAKLRGEEPPAAVAPAVAAKAWEIPRSTYPLTEGDRAVEAKFTQAMQGDYEGMKARYAQLPDAVGGKVLNTDTARELSPDYLADRTKSAAVHEPASSFIQRLYAEKLAQAPAAGEEPVVLFTAGGTGAGKSTAVKNVLGEEAARAQIVYDTNMNGTKSAVTKIDQALAAGKEVKIAYVHREPIEALTQGALKRAMRQERDFGSGRTVPIEEHVNTHVGANNSVREIAAHYANDPRVTMRVIDNSRGAGGARLIDLEELPRIDYNRTHEQALAALETAKLEGRISEPVYRGFRGQSAARPGSAAAAESGAGGNAGAAGAEAGGLGTGPGRQPQQERPLERPDQLTREAALKHYLGKDATVNDFLRNGPAGKNLPADASETLKRLYAEENQKHLGIVAAIDKAFESPERLAADTTVERGLHWEPYVEESGEYRTSPDDLATAFREGKLKPGEILRDSAYMSTTDDHERAIGFAKQGSEAVNLSDPYSKPKTGGDNVILKINVPKDTPYVSGERPGSTSGYGHEGEKIFARGSGIRVTDVGTEKSKTGEIIHVVTGDYVAPEAQAQKAKADPLADPAHQAVQENPQLQIPDQDGNLVNAAKTLSDAEQSTADAERDMQKALAAAVNCFQRRSAA